MKKLILGFMLILDVSFANQRILGLHCGTRGTLIGTIASDLFIPDFFPPEHVLVRMLLAPFVDLTICDDIGQAHLGLACEEHDKCYGSKNATKEVCDEDMLNGWQKACSNQYLVDQSSEVVSYCLQLCNDAVGFMYDTFSYDDGIFCPSCIAFKHAQEDIKE
jgi:hypothetical protein